MSRLSFEDLETRKFAPACLAAMRPAVDAAPLRAGDRDELCIGAVLLTHSLDQALQVISASALRAHAMRQLEAGEQAIGTPTRWRACGRAWCESNVNEGAVSGF